MIVFFLCFSCVFSVSWNTCLWARIPHQFVRVSFFPVLFGFTKYWWSPVLMLLRMCLQVSVGKLANQFSLLRHFAFSWSGTLSCVVNLKIKMEGKKQKNETLCCRKNQTFFISDVIWNENDVQNNVFSEVRSQYGTVVRKWKKNQL